MDNKSDLFDLKREKRELDNFLSTITGADEPTTAPSKEAAPIKETVSQREVPPVQAAQPEEKAPAPEPPKPRQLASAPRPEDAFMQPEYHEKPKPSEAEVKPVKRLEEEETKPKIKSSFLPEMEEKKEKPLSKMVDIQETKAPENVEGIKPFERASFEEEFKAEDAMPAEKTAGVDFEDERKALEEALYAPAPVEKKAGKGKLIGLLIVVVIVLAAGAFWLYSDPIVNTAKSIPGVGSLIKSFASVEKDVNLTNVRQRLVENKKTGKSIRVIEGVATNTSPQTISKIRITATLQDADGKELISMESVAGNILIDEKLENLDARAIQAELQSTTAKGAQDKIPPKGQQPFMIVFTNEPPGVFKMSVTPVDFTKP